MTSGEVTMTYMTSYDVILTPKPKTGGNYPMVGGLCKISPSCQLNVTVVFCYIVAE